MRQQRQQSSPNQSHQSTVNYVKGIRLRSQQLQFKQNQIINGMQFIDKIGQGTYGVVGRFKDKNGNQFAIKRVQFFQNDKQAQILSSTNDSNIVKLLWQHHAEESKTRQFCFPLSQYDLQKYILMAKRSNIPLSLFQKRHIIGQITRGLLTLHQKNFVHADLKTNNILVFGRKFCITDFGFSNQAGKFTFRNFASVLCPPQCTSEESSYLIRPSFDIWSLGIVAWQILTDGMTLFKRGTSGKQKLEVVNSDAFKTAMRLNFTSDTFIFFKSCLCKVSQRLTAQQLLKLPFLANSQLNHQQFQKRKPNSSTAKTNLKRANKKKKMANRTACLQCFHILVPASLKNHLKTCPKRFPDKHKKIKK